MVQGSLFSDPKAQEDYLAERSKDFRRLQNQKARIIGGVEARIILSMAFCWGEQYISQTQLGIVSEPPEDNRLRLVFNLINGQRRKLSGRLIHNGLQFEAQPDSHDPKSLANAEVVTKLVAASDRIVDQPSLTWQVIDWLLRAGVAFEMVTWVPDATVTPLPDRDEAGKILFDDKMTGQVVNEDVVAAAQQQGEPTEHFVMKEVAELAGEIGDEVLSPLNVFLDQSCKSVKDLSPDQWIYVARMRTKGWVEQNYGDQVNIDDIKWSKDLRIVTTQVVPNGQTEAVASLFLKDLLPTVQGTNGSDDPDMCIVVDGWCPASKKNPRGKWCTFIPGDKLLHDGPNEYPEIPIVDYHFEPVTTTFWTKDYVTDQIAGQRFFNRRMSQLGEQSNAALYDIILLGPGLKADDVPTDKPGPMIDGLSEEGAPRVARLGPPNLPGWFLQSIDLTIKSMETIASGASLTENSKFPGQLRGPMAVPLLQEIMDTEWGPLYHHIATQMAAVKQMRINRIQQFYPAQRTLHYTDKDMRDEVVEFNSEDVFGGETKYTVHVDVGSIIPEMRALREARVIERLSGPAAILYMDERTHQLDKSKIAMDLREGDAARVNRESQARKFCGQLLERLKQGIPVPPVEQFYDHGPMMDELEAFMMTTEFLSMSPQTQDLIRRRWNEHYQFMNQAAQAQQQGMQSQMIQSAVAQATQQAAAKAASDAVSAAMDQVQAQRLSQPSVQQLVASQADQQAQAQMAQQNPNAGMPPARQRPALPFKRGPHA